MMQRSRPAYSFSCASICISALLSVLAACGGDGNSAAVPAPAAAPSITTQPADSSVSPGQSASFSVAASGTSPLVYQWQKNGATIAGATSASYSTPVTTAADDGEIFTVVVSNSAGKATSRAAKLTVGSGTSSPPPPPPAPAGTDVVTFKNDTARTGQNLTETALTSTNVSSASFGLVRNLMVDGKVDAQPLYLSHLTVQNASHNVVFAATEHDSVYAFDADTGATLWHVSLLGSGETTSGTHSCDQVMPEIGITATPVIDRTAGAHGVIYVVAMSLDSSSNYHQRLHALDVSTGAELPGGPTEISATYPNVSGTAVFAPGSYEERAALLLSGSTIYTAWTSHCDQAPYGGWVIAFSQTTLARTLVLNVAPNSGTAGAASAGPAIWMSGDGPAADNAGNVYFLTGNGKFETTLDSNGFPNQGDYGNSFMKIANNAGTLRVADYFAMSNEVAESSADQDLGSGGEMLLPDLMDSANTVKHLVVGAGKDGNIYVVDRDNMGKFSPSANHIWQELDGVVSGGVRSSPAYFNGTVYLGDVGGALKAFGITSAKLSASPTSRSPGTFTYPGTSPAVSANGTANAIVWAHENTTPAVLHAFDAANLAHELYNSNQASAGRDHFGAGNKFITPAIADGKVFVGTTNSVAVFGLLH